MAKYKSNKQIILMLFVLGIGMRCLFLGSLPYGLNQDEAFAAYEAWSLLNFGVDSAGYSYPVYLTAWGSGMNALETYLMMPFVALFGTEVWVIRLPQAILACLSLFAIWSMTRDTLGERCAVWVLGLLVICPWHIMLSRWALESNLTPAFLLFGMYFLLKAVKNSRYMLLSALMYGLSLYCYATIWPIVPILILIELLCMLRCGCKADKYWLIAALILFALALPLLLFLAVNWGLIEELKLGVFSVPKLLYMRANEINTANMAENFRNILTLLISQTDNLYHNKAGNVGLLYYISLPFVILGIIKSRDEKGSLLESFMLTQLSLALILACLINVNVNRINIIFIPMLFFAARGICRLKARITKPIALLYAVCFAMFLNFYCTDYAKTIPYYFFGGLETAIEAVADEDKTVYLPENVYHSQVMFFDKTEHEEYVKTVKYKYYPAAYLKATEFAKYIFGYDTENIDPNAAYIIAPGEDTTKFEQVGFEIEHHGIYRLAVKEK